MNTVYIETQGPAATDDRRPWTRLVTVLAVGAYDRQRQ
jgi:hypothetical protein